MVEFFKDLSFFILPLGLGSKRMEFFTKQIGAFGGSVRKSGVNVTHVLVEDSVAENKENFVAALKKHGLFGKTNVKYVKVTWISKCLGGKGLIDSKPFEIGSVNEEIGDEKRENEEIEDEKRENEENEVLPPKKQKIENESFICSKPSSSSSTKTTQRTRIIEELEKLANAYSFRNDVWRSHSYRKCINALRLYDKEITTYQEAVNIPGIGEKMASKIMEIIENGKLQKVDEIIDEKTKVLEVFCKIWGVGPSTAEGWYAQGFRTLKDLETHGKLTKQQKIGLEFYNDFQRRIPREEVHKIANIVEGEVKKVDSSLNIELVGSFRRGKSTCGDVDVMIISDGRKSSSEILMKVTKNLKIQGYITNDLVTLGDIDDFHVKNHHKKYFGVFKFLGENETHRRIDFFVVPKSEYAPALLHYTGSALFNRSMKLLATKKNMSLTEHGLYSGTIRKGSEITCLGKLVPTVSEEDIFKKLGLPYRHPEERDH